MWSRRQAMTFLHAEDSVFHDTSPALLALKRFVRNTFRQLGIGLVALMVVLNVGAHERSHLLANELASEPAGSSQNAQRLAFTQTLTAASTSRLPIAEHAKEHLSGYSHRFGQGITYHHLTSARLSLAPLLREQQQSIASVNEAGVR